MVCRTALSGMQCSTLCVCECFHWKVYQILVLWAVYKRHPRYIFLRRKSTLTDYPLIDDISAYYYFQPFVRLASLPSCRHSYHCISLSLSAPPPPFFAHQTFSCVVNDKRDKVLFSGERAKYHIINLPFYELNIMASEPKHYLNHTTLVQIVAGVNIADDVRWSIRTDGTRTVEQQRT